MAITIDAEMKKKRYTATEAKKRGISKQLLAKYWGKSKKRVKPK